MSLAFSQGGSNPISTGVEFSWTTSLDSYGHLLGVFLFFSSLFASRLSLATEILVLRQQLLVLNRTVKRPKLRRRDRLFWVCLSRLWKDWRDALIIVKPDTVIKWHREGFRLYWRWKSKASIGRPPIDKEIRELIRRISVSFRCPSAKARKAHDFRSFANCSAASFDAICAFHGKSSGQSGSLSSSSSTPNRWKAVRRHAS
jgi:hypothetical protein